METFKRNRISKWLNIFLLVINISAFTTILLMNEKTAPKVIENKFSSDIFLKEKLDLTKEQFQTISEMDAKIFRVYQNLLDMQCEAHFKLLDELLLEQPSAERLDSIAKNIGRLHAGLKKQTIKHFTNIRSICDEEQEQLLDQLLIDMMGLGDQCQYCNKELCDRRDQLENR